MDLMDLCVCLGIEKVLEGCTLTIIVITTQVRYSVDIHTMKYYRAVKMNELDVYTAIQRGVLCALVTILLRLFPHL